MVNMHSDTREILRDLLEQEVAVRDLYLKILKYINNKEISDQIKLIMNDENKHIDNAKKMIAIHDE